MSLTLIGKKRGMTRIFDEKSGHAIPCTVIELDSNVVSQIKTLEKDGYQAVQMSAVKPTASQKKNMTKPLTGHYSKKSIEPRVVARESRIDDVSGMELGKEFNSDYFEVGSYVDVQGQSKGKGYQGVMKRFGASGMNKSHGQGPVQRHLGSSGSLTSHGRVQKNKKMAGQMGNAKVGIQSLLVVKVNAEQKALVVKGAVPGANGGTVFIRKAIKKA